MNDVLVQDLPAALQRFMRDRCHLNANAFHPCSGTDIPQPAQRLLVHRNDMTTTLASFHKSPLRVDILKKEISDELYLREVFLRSIAADTIVEYGVIAIALERFTQLQCDAITAGHTPLGALLHQFQIRFVSSPVGFFAIPAESLAGTPLRATPGTTCFGRFNRLANPAREPLAWILEILP